MDEEQLTQEQLQDLWNEEATKLDAGDAPADEPQAAAPTGDDQSPQDEPQVRDDQQAANNEPAPDPLAALPEEVKAALAKITHLEQANAQLLHHVKTAEGRVAAMQREFQQARQAATQVAAQDAPTQGQMAAAAKNPEKWEQLKQDFPEWAGAMEEYVTAKLGGVQQQAPGLSPQAVQELVNTQVAQTRQEMGRLLEEVRIESKHGDWKATVNTPEFAAWFQLQPAETRALADSPRAADAVKMLDLYETAKAKPAQDVRQERSQRLAAAATTRPGQTAPSRSLDDMSPAELWNYEARKREKSRAERGY